MTSKIHILQTTLFFPWQWIPYRFLGYWLLNETLIKSLIVEKNDYSVYCSVNLIV